MTERITRIVAAALEYACRQGDYGMANILSGRARCAK